VFPVDLLLSYANKLVYYLEALQSSMIRVEEERSKGADLGSSVPAIRAVHHNTDSLLHGLSYEKGSVQHCFHMSKPAACLDATQEVVH